MAPGAPDELTARLIESAGFSAVYMTCFGATASLTGCPDVGILTQTEMTTHARNMVRAVKVPVIADAKRGDIDHTMRLYATAVFDVYGFDAVTASPYLGRDALLPFLDRADRGTYILCRTSNPGAADIAELDVGGEPLFMRVAERVPTWTSHANIGLVVGATAPTQLARVRAVAPVVPILLPGIGAQGGDLEASVAAGLDQTGDGLLVVVARQVMYASSGLRFAEDARTAAREIRDRINAARVTAIDALRGR